MKVLNSDKIRQIEQKAVSMGMTMENLMQNAGSVLCKWSQKLLEENKADKSKIVILCGKGNNGGDGFVAAYELCKAGFEVTVILTSGDPQTELSKNAYDKMYSQSDAVKKIDAMNNLPLAGESISDANLIVDAIFGFGFSGELKGTELELVKLSNKSKAKRLSADIPSGVECDTGRVMSDAFKADITVTFSAIKPACVSYPAKAFCGKVICENVGISDDIIDSVESCVFIANNDFAKDRLPRLDAESNKGSRGKLLMICGSYSMAGACIMSAKAALRAGIGLLYIAVPRSIYPIVASEVAEAVYIIYNLENKRSDSLEKLNNAINSTDACVIGCGLGALADELCDFVFERAKKIVVDADAINYLSKNRESIKMLPEKAVLTPHPGEMSRLIDKSIGEIQSDRLCVTREAARVIGRTILLKGASTVIAEPKSAEDMAIAVNLTGNAGMAKGGSGDVLSGIIGTFLAQDKVPFEAAILGAYLHGLAGDIAEERLTERAMLPTDLIEEISSAYKYIEK